MDKKPQQKIPSNTIVDGINWMDADLSKSDIKNTIIENSRFVSVNFSQSKLHNVIFKNVVFLGKKNLQRLLLSVVWFDDCELKNVKFIDCKVQAITIRRLKSSDIEIKTSRLDQVDFDESKINLTVQNSSLNDVDLTCLKENSNFNMQGGFIDANFYIANIDNLKLNNVTTKEVGFSSANIKTASFNNSEIEIGFSAANIDILSINNCDIENISIGGAKIKDFTISNCKTAEDFGFFRGKYNNLTINNCHITALHLSQAQIKELNLNHVSFNRGFSDLMLVETAKLDDVKISGVVDFSNAKIQNLYLRNFHYDSHAQIKTDGSNLEYNAHGLRLKGVAHEATADKWIIFHWMEVNKK